MVDEVTSSGRTSNVTSSGRTSNVTSSGRTSEIVEPQMSADAPTKTLYDEIVDAWGKETTERLFTLGVLMEVEISGGAVLRGHVTHVDTNAVWLHREVDPQVAEAIGSDAMDSNVSVQRVDVVDVRIVEG